VCLPPSLRDMLYGIFDTGLHHAASRKEHNYRSSKENSPRRVITERRILDSILRTALLHALTARKEIHFYTPGGHTFQNQAARARDSRVLQLMLTQQKQLLSALFPCKRKQTLDKILIKKPK
jgi:hypothetical protein